MGRLPFAPLFRSHTHSPIGPTALSRHRTGSHPKVTPWDGSPSPRAVHSDRTRAHGHARANVPWDGRDAHGTAHRWTARARVHTLSMRSPWPARWPSTRPTRLRCRLPLLITYACRARATQAAADQVAAEQRLGRLRQRRSSASSQARTRALLLLFRRGFLQPPLRPRERHDGFLNHHRLSTKNIAVRQEHGDESSVYASAGGRVERSRARGLGGGGAEPAISIFDLPAFAPSNSCRHQPCEDLYRR